MMKWLTEKYIATQAAKGPKEALEVSIEHWQQIVDATAKEFKAERDRLADDEKYLTNDDNCGLCVYYVERRHDGCYDCPLGHCGPGSLYEAAMIVLLLWSEGKAPYRDFRRAAKRLLNHLISLRVK